MDLIRIDDNKMKIMLTPGDMQCYALDADDIDYANDDTRRAFRHILDDVRDRTGFDAQANKIYVQLYPSREGGCEMFVTKLDIICALEDSPRASPSVERRPTAHLRSRPQPVSEGERRRSVAFAFEMLEHLLCVCRRLRSHSFLGSSAAYHSEEGRYYLLLTEAAQGPRLTLFDRPSVSFISEYGIEQNAELVKSYIREHGHPICERDAVARLSKL